MQETLCFSIRSLSPNLDDLPLRCETVSCVVGSSSDWSRIGLGWVSDRFRIVNGVSTVFRACVVDRIPLWFATVGSFPHCKWGCKWCWWMSCRWNFGGSLARNAFLRDSRCRKPYVFPYKVCPRTSMIYICGGSDLSADFLHFGASDFPSKNPYKKCFKIVFFSLWRRDPVLELQFPTPLRVFLLCFATQSPQIALEWLRQGCFLLWLHA